MNFVVAFGLAVMSASPFMAIAACDAKPHNVRTVSVAPGAAFDSLCRARRFAVGAGWISSDPPSEARLLRAVLAGADPFEACARLVREGTPAARLYGLCGMRLLDSGNFENYLPLALRDERLVETLEGCLLYTRPVASVADRIRRGEFDADLSALMPTARR